MPPIPPPHHPCPHSTEDNHPDKDKILQAINTMTDVATAINEYKRRKDLGRYLWPPIPPPHHPCPHSTEDNHPDKDKILQAINAMTDVATAINEYKRRKDLGRYLCPLSPLPTTPVPTQQKTIAQIRIRSYKLSMP